MLTDAEQNKADVRLRNWENTYRTDPLTGLLNHAAFRSDMEQRLLECTHTAVMIMMDVDRFKQYNDTYGHLNGDAVLSELGRTIRNLIRDADSAYRYGGEEFIIILPESNREEAARVAERIRLAFFEHTFFPAPGTGVHVSISLGVTSYVYGESVSDLVDRADQNMYAAKKSGRNTTVCR